MSELLHQLVLNSAKRVGSRVAIIHKDRQWTYQDLATLSESLSQQLLELGLSANGRVVIYLPKQIECVTAILGTSMAGGVFVPANPQLKAPQLSHIIENAEAEILITSKQRFVQLQKQWGSQSQFSTPLKTVIVDADPAWIAEQTYDKATINTLVSLTSSESEHQPHRRINQDLSALLYTSGSTGAPKGVMLSHQNLVAGAKSVAMYLNNHQDDRILSVLPFSFDYGLSQLTTAFLTGASVVLMDYLLPRDVIKAVEKYQITGLAAVPPLWIQLANLEWPANLDCLRYITNSGGAMPTSTLLTLRHQLPNTATYLMYGLTEAFRSTYLEPHLVDKKPTSIGKAIPNAEILVLNEHGEQCSPHEHGELVHRGEHVALGYWKAPEKTAERFKLLPHAITNGRDEIAVYSGDTVYYDEEGHLYFVGRNDEMIKSSGYRISPSEVEDVLHSHSSVKEVAVVGVPHFELGQAIVLAIVYSGSEAPEEREKSIKQFCQQQLPNYMQPKHIAFYSELPKNANGKIDRAQLFQSHRTAFVES